MSFKNIIQTSTLEFFQRLPNQLQTDLVDRGNDAIQISDNEPNSRTFKNIGKIINIKDEAVSAKFVLVLKKLEKVLDVNPSNFPILIAKYGDSCQWAIENVQPRIDFYTAQYEKKFEN